MISLKEINISTERLILRKIRLSDAEAMFNYRSNPLISKYQGFKPQSLEDIKEFICEKVAITPNVPDTWYQLGIVNSETDVLVGDIGIHFIDPDNLQIEIGYTLSLENQGKGYAAEAVSSVINYLFSNLDKHRVIASVDPRNIKSIALLERIGMRKEAHFIKSYWCDNEWTDDVVYAILKEEWISKKQQGLRIMENYTISQSTKEEYLIVDDGIVEYNLGKVPFTQTPSFLPINRVIKNSKGEVLAGINSMLYCWECLYVDVLWVKEGYRKEGFGSKLLNEVENIAKEKGCKLIHLDTFDFQAKDFYIKHGFEIFGVLDDCPLEHKRYYMKKKL